MINESFKRYLVFLWDQYDNESPIPDTSESFDSEDLATEYARKNVRSRSGLTAFGAILDLEKRKFLNKYCLRGLESKDIAVGFTPITMESLK